MDRPDAGCLLTEDAAFTRAAALAERLDATLATAEALLSGGRAVDLAGLEEMVGMLCAACLDLPAEGGGRIGPGLAVLLTRLEALDRTMRAES